MMRITTIPYAVAAAGAGALWLAACGVGPATAGLAPVAPPALSANVAPRPLVLATSTPEPTSPFYVIGELPIDLLLFGAGERGFLVSQAGVELQLVGDEIVQDPLLKRGLPVTVSYMLSVDGVGGRYPDAFWLSTSEPRGRTGFSALWRWDGKNWQRNASLGDTHYITSILPWVGGRMLALEQSSLAFDASFIVLSGDTRVALPQFTKSKKSKEEFAYCRTRLKPEQWATLPTGDVIAIGQHCDPEQDYQELAVERWGPGAKTSTIDILPGIHEPGDSPIVSYTATGIAAISPSDVFVAAYKDVWSKDTPTKRSPYFAHFDGQTWQALPSPIPGGVRSLWSEPGGAIFASNDKSELWSRGANGKWSPTPWPRSLTEQGELKLVGFWPRSAGDDWAVVEVASPQKGRLGYLLHTRPAVNAVPTLEAMSRKERSLRLPGPPVDWCETRFVLLYTLARKAPVDYDYPATRKALKGHSELAVEGVRFVEFEREGRRYFGARVPDFDLGEKLAKLVKDQVPGSTPELVCLDPLENRTLDIDLTTGDLRK
jgi:hypothetical protein